jgi:hypothetical protein
LLLRVTTLGDFLTLAALEVRPNEARPPEPGLPEIGPRKLGPVEEAFWRWASKR